LETGQGRALEVSERGLLILKPSQVRDIIVALDLKRLRLCGMVLRLGFSKARELVLGVGRRLGAFLEVRDVGTSVTQKNPGCILQTHVRKDQGLVMLRQRREASLVGLESGRADSKVVQRFSKPTVLKVLLGHDTRELQGWSIH
jgi:hypothetical protein